jgi:hypothetical protein
MRLAKDPSTACVLTQVEAEAMPYQWPGEMLKLSQERTSFRKAGGFLVSNIARSFLESLMRDENRVKMKKRTLRRV